jgi:hypothetical protein
VVESVLETNPLGRVFLKQLDQKVLAFWSEGAPARKVKLKLLVESHLDSLFLRFVVER